MVSQNREALFEMAILARLTWNLHSLNNEGTLGNVSEPRTVVLWDGQRSDGVSGEMMKHIHAFWVWLAASSAGDSHLCAACRDFRPQRADLIKGNLSKNDNAAAMREALACTLCDLHGFLVQNPTIHRQSVVEFGWVVGVPGRVQRDLHTHARHAATERGVETRRRGTEESGQDGTAPEEVAGQMVYHRPTRSGVYAFVSLFQPWRIGLNEITYGYAIDSDARRRRYALAIEAYEWTLKRPDGAMRSTRLPHIERAEGVIVVSKKATPVPILSPLRDDYLEKVESLAQIQGCEVATFADVDEMAEQLSRLKELEPFALERVSSQ
ncbi:MAG: DevR family CRISPR-associated autoregulator [Thermomicrobium sp.]|nr:DevR family CRISPR-associated autoregulator [Thermomicrobium sp.]